MIGLALPTSDHLFFIDHCNLVRPRLVLQLVVPAIVEQTERNLLVAGMLVQAAHVGKAKPLHRFVEKGFVDN